MPVTNEGLGWDSLFKNGIILVVTGILGGGVVPSDTTLRKPENHQLKFLPANGRGYVIVPRRMSFTFVTWRCSPTAKLDSFWLPRNSS